MINICSVKKNDYSILRAIESSLFEKSTIINGLQNITGNISVKIWKLVTTEIIGYIYFYHVKDEVEIINIGILKQYQHKGYGSIIIKEIKKLKLKKIFLEVSAENTHAINFYIKNGFKKIGRRKAYYKGNNKRIDALRLLFEF